MSASIVTRTLLLTDLVGSTKLVEQLGDRRAAELFAKIDRIVRDTVAATDGLEIDKTDGFLLLFDRAVDGVRCAHRIHNALEELSGAVGRPVHMRAGVHVGEVVLRENTLEDTGRGAKPIEVEGLAKPMAARIMSLADGGQTLLSRPAHEMAKRASIGDPELGAMRWANHGPYRLAGVSDPIDIYEVSPRRPRAPAASEKVRRVRRGMGCLLPSVVGLLLAIVGLGGGWLYQRNMTYTSLQGLAQVSLQPEIQASYEAAWSAFGAGDLRQARAGVDDLAAVLPHHPDVRLAQLAFTLSDLRQVPEELQAEIDAALDEPWVIEGPDHELVAFIEKWKIEGWEADKLHSEIHDFRDRHADHLVALLLSIELHAEQARDDEIPALVDELLGSSVPLVAAWRLRADAQIATADFTAAETTLTEGLAEFPGNLSLSKGLAALRLQRGDVEGALVLVRPLLEDPSSPSEERATVIAGLLELGRADEIAPLLDGFEEQGEPRERVAFALEVARTFALHGRMEQARALASLAYTEAEAATLSDAWVDVVDLDLAWATDPDVTSAERRAETLDRAEQGLLLPWMADAALRRLRTEVLAARTVVAWLDGDVEAARSHGASLEVDAASDPFGAARLLAFLDDPEGFEVPPEACREARDAGELWLHDGHEALARDAFAAATRETCPRSARERADQAKTAAHLAVLCLAAGESSEASHHTVSFREQWRNADPDLPAFRAVLAVEQTLASRHAPDKTRRGKRGKKRRR